MDSDNDDKISKGADRIFGDSLLSVGELGLTLSDAYCDLSSTAVSDFVELGTWSCESKKEKPATSKPSVQENSFESMSLLVGDLQATESLFGRLNQAVPGHAIRRCQLEEAFMMCNTHRFQLIWMVVTTPISQETLSFTTTIRYMCMSRLNQNTRIACVSEKSLDVDLQPHGIDVVLVEPVTYDAIRRVYNKWSTLDMSAGMLDLSRGKSDDTPVGSGEDGSSSNETVTRMEDDSNAKLPMSSLMAALQGVRNSYQPRPKLPIVSDHTTKEKMRRERIKDSCDQLRVLLPYIRGRKTDMASVLEMCVDYLRIVNLALPTEFKSEVADILGKDCQLTTSGKGRAEPKCTPRKRKRDLTKPPELPSPNFGPSSIENSPMYTPPATPGSETGSESVASPMSFTMDQSVMSPQETCYVKLETTSFETSVSAPKAMVNTRNRSKVQQGNPSRTTHSFVPVPRNDLYKIYHGGDLKVPSPAATQRGLEYLAAQRARLPGCYSFSVFNRSADMGLPPPNTFFQSNVGGNLILPDKEAYRGGMEMEDPMGRFSSHPAFSLPGGSHLTMDPLINYVNPNAVLPVSYATRYTEPSATGDTPGKSDM